MPTASSFERIENQRNVYRGKDCMKHICESLREQTMEVINFEKKNTKLFKKKSQQESHETA